MLHKLFSTMLYNRLYAKLDSYQFLDQAEFRRIPDDRSSYDVQTYCTKKQRMEN